MGLYDVPSGVKARTGILMDAQELSSEIPAGETTVGANRRVNFDIGSGFVVGIHGMWVRHSTLGGSGTVESSFSATRVFLDPQVMPISNSIVGGYHPDDSSIVMESVHQWTPAASTDGHVQDGNVDKWIPGGPVLTVKDLLVLSFINAAATRDMNIMTAIYYSIYEVTDAEFLRIAGASLSRS